MPRELLVMRHARAGAGAGIRDRDRPLEPAGELDARRIGHWLAAADVLPDATVASPALRAQTTARLVLRGAGVDPAPLETIPDIYEADLPDLLGVVSRHADAPGRLLIVGHNPGLEALVRHLCASPAALTSGTLVRLEMPASWRHPAPGCARALDLVTPEDAPSRPPPPRDAGED